MKLLILLFFIAVPLAEIAVFVKVGGIIGIGATVALVILTAVIGVALLKRQGLAALARAQASVDAGEIPVDSVIDGASLLIAGAFLLTPGLITDTAGFLLLIPAIRHGIARWVLARIRESGSVHVWTSRGRGRPSREPSPDGKTIEGEFREVDEDTARLDEAAPPDKPGPKSPWRK